MITLIQAMKSAVSVPGRNCTQMSANLPASVLRGSMTMSLRSPSAIRFLSRWKSRGAVPLRLQPSMTRHLRLGSFGSGVGHAQERVVHGHRVAAADGARAADVRGVAEQVEKARAHGVHVAAVGALVDGERLGPVLLLELGELGRDLVEGLVPRDLLPLVLAPLPLPLQGMQELLRAVEPLDVVRHPVGAAVVGRRVVRVAPQTDQLAVFDRGDQPALVDAAR